MTKVTTKLTSFQGPQSSYETLFLVDTGAIDSLAPSDELKKIGAKFSSIKKDRDYEAYAEIDFKFHEFFPGIIGNAFLVAEIRKMRNKLFRLRAPQMVFFDHVNEFVIDHEKIIEAMSEKDPEKARDAMELHVKGAKDHFIRFLQENPWLL